MKRYIALLRGINISGKNKIPMAELKSCFIEHGYIDVFTYLNSGNVVFSADERSEIVLADRIKAIIQERFELDIPAFVISFPCGNLDSMRFAGVLTRYGTVVLKNPSGSQCK